MSMRFTHTARGTETARAIPHDLTVAAHGTQAPIHVGGLPGPGTFDFFPGTPGDDTFTGTTGDDQFDLSDGGNDTAFGDAGIDEFDFGTALTKNDKIDGGDDYDAITMQGNYSTQLKFTATTAVNIEEIDMFGGFNYNIKLVDESLTPTGTNNAGIGDACLIFCNAGAGFTVTINAAAELDAAIVITTRAGNDTITGGALGDLISAGFGTNVINGGGGVDRVTHFSLATSVTIDLSIAGPQTIAAGVTNTYINIEDVSGTVAVDSLTGNKFDNWLWGNSANDTLIGAKGNDRLEGSLGADYMRGDAGDDHYVYGIADGLDAAVCSTSTNFDTIDGFDFAADHFETTFAPAAIDAKVKNGALSDATFDTDLANAVTAAKLAAGDAVLFTPKTGDHAGDTFLIIDHNGTAGYQASADVVIKLDNGSHLTSLDVTDFIVVV